MMGDKEGKTCLDAILCLKPRKSKQNKFKTGASGASGASDTPTKGDHQLEIKSVRGGSPTPALSDPNPNDNTEIKKLNDTLIKQGNQNYEEQEFNVTPSERRINEINQGEVRFRIENKKESNIENEIKSEGPIISETPTIKKNETQNNKKDGNTKMSSNQNDEKTLHITNDIGSKTKKDIRNSEEIKIDVDSHRIMNLKASDLSVEKLRLSSLENGLNQGMLTSKDVKKNNLMNAKEQDDKDAGDRSARYITEPQNSTPRDGKNTPKGKKEFDAKGYF
jgi:hypothetical protein